MERIQYFEISILVQLQLSIFKSNHAEVFCNKGLLKISENSQENTCTRVSFLRKLQSSACNFIKQESRTQVFSCEICETFKKTFLYRTLWWQRFNIVCQSKHYEYYPRMSFFTQEIDFLIFSRSIERGW